MKEKEAKLIIKKGEFNSFEFHEAERYLEAIEKTRGLEESLRLAIDHIDNGLIRKECEDTLSQWEKER